MNLPGDAEPLVAARRTLLDALEALAEQRDALVLIGAQAIYLHTGAAPVALAETTRDSNLAVDPRILSDSPLLNDGMTRARLPAFRQRPTRRGNRGEGGGNHAGRGRAPVREVRRRAARVDGSAGRGAVGVAMGGLATVGYAHTKHWAVVIPAEAWAGGIASAILIGAVAGLMPAIRAARLSPTDALRTV